MVPTHWGFDGVADAWSRKGFLSWFGPALMITGVYVFLTVGARWTVKGRVQLRQLDYVVFRGGVLLALLTLVMVAIRSGQPALMRWFLLGELFLLLALTVFQSRHQANPMPWTRYRLVTIWLVAGATVLGLTPYLSGIVAVLATATPTAALLAWVMYNLVRRGPPRSWQDRAPR
jgi:hypothetical protein